MEIKYKTYFPFSVVFFLLTTFYMLLIQEWLARNSLFEAANWLNSYPGPVLLNLSINAMVLAFFIALIGRIRLGLIFGSIILLLLAGINAMKIAILHTPFLAWDLLYARQLLALGNAMLPGYAWMWIIFFSIGLLLLIINHDRKTRKGLKVRIRIAIMTGVLSFTSIFCWQSVFIFNMLHIQKIAWDQIINHHDNGFLLAFSMNISPLLIKKPSGYGRELVEKVMTHQNSSGDLIGFNGHPVSLVIVQSESFSDLCGAPLKTNVDPMANFKRLASVYPHFTLVSPTFAGDTSLVEYELLTGLSNAFLPQGSIPFEHYIRRQTPSLPWILGQKGYKTIAVHPFYDWFWKRNTVYPLLGFDEFITIDKFEGATKRGEFISDESMVDKIIQLINEQKGAYMIYAVSMQNHGPFWRNRYKENEVTISANVSHYLRSELEAYLTGVLDADKQLERLVKYLENRKEPVICLFYGDHQPAFIGQLLGEMGMVREYPTFLLQLAQVPGLLWANNKELLKSIAIPAQFSPNYLTPILLQQMGIPLPGHFSYLMKGINDIPVINRGFVCDSSGTISWFKRQRLSPYLKGLEMLNYDVLFGSKFCWQLPEQPKAYLNQ